MPADKPKVGTGPRRQAEQTDPNRRDDSRKELDRAIERETDRDPAAEHDPGWQPGAETEDGPLRRAKPGTRRAIEESGLGETLDEDEEAS